MNETQIAIRIILTVVLLIFVWFNAHWSVALALTLMSISIEANSIRHQ